MKKISVLYLSTKYTKILNLKNFIKFYKKFKSGVNHNLIICFKDLDSRELKKRQKLLKSIRYNFFIDTKNKNHEWGSIKLICQAVNPSILFYMNDYSYPLKNNWLKIIVSNYKKKRIIGCSASLSSWATNAKYRNFKDNFLIYIYKFIYFNLTVPKFPNPHLRSNGFLIHTSDYLEFIKNKKITNRIKSYTLESGYNGFTKFFKSKNYELLVINSDGALFEENNWKTSNTYAYLNQDKLLISDKNTRDYLKLNKKSKKKKQFNVWGTS